MACKNEDRERVSKPTALLPAETSRGPTFALIPIRNESELVREARGILRKTKLGVGLGGHEVGRVTKIFHTASGMRTF